MEPQKILNYQSSFDEKEFTLLDFRLFYRAKVIKTACYWHKKQIQRLTGENREPRNKPTNLWPINLQQIMQEWRKDSIFKKWCWEN